VGLTLVLWPCVLAAFAGDGALWRSERTPAKRALGAVAARAARVVVVGRTRFKEEFGRDPQGNEPCSLTPPRRVRAADAGAVMAALIPR